MSSREIFVFISLGEENFFVGKLWCHSRKGRESASFEYDRGWLDHPERFSLEPALPLTEGIFHTNSDQMIFGALGDSAPDRWGRVLMRRAENQRAKSKNEIARTLYEVDYLLGVNDQVRQGGLRFCEKPEGPFLSSDKQNVIPSLVNLPKLLTATEHFIHENESASELKLLLAPGSSLGGARPKASVLDQDGNLAIAKFPRDDDEFNIVLWEAVALTLARKAGIVTPKWRIEKVLEKSVLIIQRFDRFQQMRIPFLSAMSMLGAHDNEIHSYIEIAYAIIQYGVHPQEDLRELWRRIVFNILISNTDDHLRNHGFLYERQCGWKLSPAYDLNPTPIEIKPRILTTMIDLVDNTASLEMALSVINDFRLSNKEAKSIIREVYQAIKCWDLVAKNIGLNKKEIERMSSAFEHEDFYKAKEI